MDVIVKLDSYTLKVIPSVAGYTSDRDSWRASSATPAFSMHGICNPITGNGGLHTGAIPM